MMNLEQSQEVGELLGSFGMRWMAQSEVLEATLRSWM